MPKIVDWEARKDEILEATWRVISRDGLSRTTVRAIALEANCSQGILSHYFNDKLDILASALLLSHRRVRERTEKKVRGLKGLAALRLAMLEALPLDAERELEEAPTCKSHLRVRREGSRQVRRRLKHYSPR